MSRSLRPYHSPQCSEAPRWKVLCGFINGLHTCLTYHCTLIGEAGHNMKTKFGVTNSLLGRSAPAQLPESFNDVALAESFKQFFVTLRRAINSPGVTTTIPDQQSFGYHQTAQLSEFTLATTADIRHIVLTSSATFCTLDPIPTNLLKENIDIVASIQTDIINTSLESGVVTATMKHAMVSPILK